LPIPTVSAPTARAEEEDKEGKEEVARRRRAPAGAAAAANAAQRSWVTKRVPQVAVRESSKAWVLPTQAMSNEAMAAIDWYAREGEGEVIQNKVKAAHHAPAEQEKKSTIPLPHIYRPNTQSLKNFVTSRTQTRRQGHQQGHQRSACCRHRRPQAVH